MGPCGTAAAARTSTGTATAAGNVAGPLKLAPSTRTSPTRDVQDYESSAPPSSRAL